MFCDRDLSISRRPTTSRLDQTSLTDPTFSFFWFFFKNIYLLLYPVICTDSQVVYVHEIFRGIVVVFVAAENKELVLVCLIDSLRNLNPPLKPNIHMVEAPSGGERNCNQSAAT